MIYYFLYNKIMFHCDEIIFSVTTKCNLKCPHCFVSRTNSNLSVEECKKFIESAISFKENSAETDFHLEKIGFTGGEPFLNLEFLKTIIAFAVENDLYFDRLMTNGVWWKDSEELLAKMTEVVEEGFDGKIGLSYDGFHNQSYEKIKEFLKTAYQVFSDNTSVEILTVLTGNKIVDEEIINNVEKLRKELGEEYEEIYLPQYISPESIEYDVNNPEKFWSDKKWFTDDFCQSTGNIFYVHTDGNIAPCCGFANENPELFIGNIHMTWEEVVANAKSNPMVKNCFETGLGNLRKKLEKSGTKFPGKTTDICGFCDYYCKNHCKK